MTDLLLHEHILRLPELLDGLAGGDRVVLAALAPEQLAQETHLCKLGIRWAGGQVDQMVTWYTSGSQVVNRRVLLYVSSMM